MEVIIRPLHEDDAKVSMNWRNDPDIWRLTGSRPDKTVTLQDEVDWIRGVIADPSSERFAIISDGTYVGNIYLTDITDRQAEYHIFIGEKSFWSRGIARRASYLLLNYAKETLHLQKVALEVHEDNAPALHLYRSFGFKPTSASGNTIHMALSMRDYTVIANENDALRVE